MTVLTTRATYSGGVLKPIAKLDLPDGASVEVQISTVLNHEAVDPKDALMDNATTLQYLYAEFAQEDRQLADAGLEHYARTLENEEHQE